MNAQGTCDRCDQEAQTVRGEDPATFLPVQVCFRCAQQALLQGPAQLDVGNYNRVKNLFSTKLQMANLHLIDEEALDLLQQLPELLVLAPSDPDHLRRTPPNLGTPARASAVAAALKRIGSYHVTESCQKNGVTLSVRSVPNPGRCEIRLRETIELEETTAP